MDEQALVDEPAVLDERLDERLESLEAMLCLSSLEGLQTTYQMMDGQPRTRGRHSTGNSTDRRWMITAAGLALMIVVAVIGRSVLAGVTVPVVTETAGRPQPVVTTTVDSAPVTSPATEPPPDPEAVAGALVAAGYDDITVSLVEGHAYLDGVVPLVELETGFFTYADGARQVVAAVPGVEAVSSRLHLRGDPVALAEQLAALAPVTFDLGSSHLDDESVATLERVADLINSQPGLLILVAGHTDASGSTGANEGLAGDRAQAAIDALIAGGVAVNRLSLVSYGELFATATSGSRRIAFEVGL